MMEAIKQKNRSRLKKGEVKFKVTKILDARKEGSEIELNKEFVGKISENKQKIFYTDKAGCEWIFWIGLTCQLS